MLRHAAAISRRAPAESVTGTAGGWRRSGAPALLVSAALAAASLALAISAAARCDVTLDERFYFGAGASILESGWSGRGPLLHPPLGYYVSSLPLAFLPQRASARDAPALMACRAASLAVFSVPLLATVFLWARERHGGAAAAAAVALAAFSPTMLAHAPLITPDLPLTATGFVAVYLYWRERRSAARPAAWGAALGLALLSKGSAWLFVAAILALASIGASNRPARLRAAAAGLATAWLVLNAGYGFSGLLDLQGKSALVAKAPAGLARAAAWAAAPLFPLPYLQSMATQMHVAAQGVPAFLMGEVSSRGFWSYFLVAFAVKETLPFLILLVLAAAALVRARGPLREELPLLLPAALFFLAFSAGRVQIGIRYVLPALPFLAVSASRLFGSRPDGRAPAPLLTGVLAAHVLAAALAHPYYIAYFNELVGGPSQGHRYLVDSNLDWGQDRTRAQALARMREWAFEPDVLPSAGKVVVGATRLMLLDRDRYRALRESRPVDEIGYSYLVYDLGDAAAGARP